MQSISSSLKADYIELANEKLDLIPILNEEDFKIVRIALKCLINNKAIPETLPQDINHKVKGLKELLDSPGLYVEQEALYPIFNSIITEKIKSKIKELKNLDHQTKQERIGHFKALQEKAAQNSEALLKVSEGHIISLEPEILAQASEILEDFFIKLLYIENYIATEKGVTVLLLTEFKSKNSCIPKGSIEKYLAYQQQLREYSNDYYLCQLKDMVNQFYEFEYFAGSFHINPNDIVFLLDTYFSIDLRRFDPLGLIGKVNVVLIPPENSTFVSVDPRF